MKLTHVHEAGHALASKELGIAVLGYATGCDEHGAYSCCMHAPTDEQSLRYIAAGGAAAELVVYGEIGSSFSALASDLESGFTSWKDFESTVQKVASWFSRKMVLAEAARARAALSSR